MNGYIALWGSKRAEVCAETSYHAQQRAAAIFKLSSRRAWEVRVTLAEKDGAPVIHVATE